MKNLLLLSVFLLASVAFAASSHVAKPSKCSIGESLISTSVCDPKAKELSKELKNLREFVKPPMSAELVLEKILEVAAKCEETFSCFSKFKCARADEADKKTCDNLKLISVGFVDCFKKVHFAAYAGKNNCTKKFNFFEKDIVERRKMMTDKDGKQCYLDLVKSECKMDSFQLLTDNYDMLVHIITTKPDNNKCKGLLHELEADKCHSIGLYGRQKQEEIMKGFKVDDENILDLIRSCEDLEICLSNTCKVPMKTKLEIKETCDFVKAINTPFMSCMSKVQNLNGDSAKYPCFEKKDRCENFDEKVECFKNVIADHCGAAAAAEVDANKDLLKKIVDC